MNDKTPKPSKTQEVTKHTSSGDYGIRTKVTFDPQTYKPIAIERKITQK